jgi:hypothetical protein
MDISIDFGNLLQHRASFVALRKELNDAGWDIIPRSDDVSGGVDPHLDDEDNNL